MTARSLYGNGGRLKPEGRQQTGGLSGLFIRRSNCYGGDVWLVGLAVFPMKALTAFWLGLTIGICAWGGLAPAQAEERAENTVVRQRVKVDPLAFTDRTGLRAGDTLSLHVFFIPKRLAEDLKGQYVVSDEGFVSIPLVGPVQAAGLQMSDFEVLVQASLRQLNGEFAQARVVCLQGAVGQVRIANDRFQLTPFRAGGLMDLPGPGYRQQVRDATIRAKEMR
jgi:hypothetical protein